MDISKAIAYLKRGELGGSNVAPPKAFLTAETTIGNLCGQVFSHEAAVFYLVDAGDNYTFVTEEMAATADLSDDDLHTLAVANLAEEVESMQLLDLGNSVMFTGSGNFEASAVLVDSLWESLESRFPNGVVAALPSRDVLSVCDRKDADAIATMVSSSAQVWASGPSHPIAKDLYLRGDDGIWLPHEVENLPDTPRRQVGFVSNRHRTDQ